VLKSTAGPELVEMQEMLLEVIRVQSRVSINWSRLTRYHKPVGNSVLQSTAGPGLVEMQEMLLEVIKVQSGVSINWSRLTRYHKPVGIYSACKPTKLPQV